MPMYPVLRLAIGIASVMLTCLSFAQPVRVNVASFNMGWWTSSGEFAQVLAHCSGPPRNWCDPRNGGKCEPMPEGLPPCNAFTEYHPRRGAQAAPVFLPTAAYWAARREALEYTLRNVAPDVIGFQEISGEAAAREALGDVRDEFDYCASSDRPSGMPEVQRLVIAARKSMFTKVSCETDQTLSVEDLPRNPGHFTRPALVMELAGPRGQRWRIANVHLKSGCASPAGDSSFDFRGAYLDSAENPNCPVLRQQVPHLERLIEKRAETGVNFVLLGDFNRKLDLEMSPKAGTARPGGTGAGVPDASTAVRLLWPEVNDKDPATSELTLLYREARDGACAPNEGLDHIAISRALAAQNSRVRAREVPLATFGAEFKASDHCPLVVQLLAP